MYYKQTNIHRKTYRHIGFKFRKEDPLLKEDEIFNHIVLALQLVFLLLTANRLKATTITLTFERRTKS